MNKFLSLLGSAGVVLSASTALAGTKTWDFSTDPTLDTTLNITGNNPQIWQKTTGNPGGFLALTYSVDSQNSVVIFPDIDDGKLVTAFQFDCDLRIGNPQGALAADGFSISFARATDPVLADPSLSNFRVSGGPEDGTSTGIAIGFDTWAGNTLPDSGYDGTTADLKGLIIAVDNKTILKYAMPTSNGEADDATSQQTGPRDAAYWAKYTADEILTPEVYANPAAWSGLAWRHLSVALDQAGKLTVKWKGTTVLDAFQTDYFPSAGQIVLACRTGGENENTHFDNITLTTTATADATPPAAVTNFKVTETGAGHVSLAWNASTDLPDANARVVYNIQRNGTNLVTLLQTTNYVDYYVKPGNTYTYQVQAQDVAQNKSAFTSTITATTVADTDAVGILKGEVYYNLEGGTVDAQAISGLTSDRAIYCNGLTIGNVNGNSGFNESFGDAYAARVTGTITPTVSGSYDFFIRSDDGSALYLNTAGAALPDPTTANPICQETDCCNPFQEPGIANTDTTTYSTTTTPISLTAGKAYGFVVLLKEGGGGDGAAVAWRLTTDKTPAANLVPIAGSVLAGKQDSVGTTISLTQSPKDATVIANEPTSFSALATAVSPYGNTVTYEWFKNGVSIYGANTSTYSIPVADFADNGAKIKVTASANGAKVSSEVTLTVLADTKTPAISYVTGEETGTALMVTFSEPVNTPSSTTAANYTLDKGGKVNTVTVVDNYTVKLATDKLTENTVYTLSVTNVKDNAGNTPAANAKYIFQSWGMRPGYAKMEQWNNITGTAIDDIFNANVLDTAPNATRYLFGLTTGPSTGENFGDNYGARVKAYVIPSETASYNFYTASDDASAVYLSQNETFPDPATTTPICIETDCCDGFVESTVLNDDGSTHATTQTPIALTAGKKYAVVVLLKEGGGGDFVQVAMQKSTGTNAANTLKPATDLIYWYGPAVVTNILAKGDAIVPSSSHTPDGGGENAPNVLDGDSGTKYLNFDKLNTGFTVTPALGSTIISGIQITTGGDEEPRDPASYLIEGSNDGTTFTKITSGNFPHTATRKAKLDAIMFVNTTAYSSYRVTFPTVYNAASANSMQVADVALLGNVYGGVVTTTPVGDKPKLNVAKDASGNAVITFEGTLQSTTTVNGAWTDESATSPATITPAKGAMKFYRAKK